MKEINKNPDGYEQPYERPDGSWTLREKGSRLYQWPILKSRYQVGEVVYIKEAWATENKYNHLKPRDIPQTAKIFYLIDGYDPFTMGKARSPLFMMEWMARDFIQITDVGAERLQEITEEDCKKEGLGHQEPYDVAVYDETESYPIAQYAELWDSINKAHPWASNPWVWRYEFKRVDKPTGLRGSK